MTKIKSNPHPVDNSQTILLLAQDVDVVGIDEAQFFDDQITVVCEAARFKRNEGYCCRT